MLNTDLREVCEDDLLGMVGAILSEPGELTELGRRCLEAINSEIQLRYVKEKESCDA